MSEYDERLDALSRMVEMQAVFIEGLAEVISRETTRTLALVTILMERGHLTAPDLERMINQLQQDSELHAEFSSDPAWEAWRKLRRTIQEVQGDEPPDEEVR